MQTENAGYVPEGFRASVLAWKTLSQRHQFHGRRYAVRYLHAEHYAITVFQLDFIPFVRVWVLGQT